MDHCKQKIGLHTVLSLSKDERDELITKTIDWALMHGLCMRPKKDFNLNVLQFAPFTLFPSYFPSNEFDNACKIQTVMNLLIHRVAHDYDFLKDSLEEIIKVDYFTKKLFDIYETVKSEGVAQKISLGLLRSDYMLNEDEQNNQIFNTNSNTISNLKQVEINTIASGFGWLGPSSGRLHNYVLQEVNSANRFKHNLPENRALQEICSGMIEAWKIYGNSLGVILFIVEDETYNICDQRFHEFEIRKRNPNVKVIRKSLTQLIDCAELNHQKELIVDNKVVSLVYFRCGYDPQHYYTEKEWDVRLTIERSIAIKSPSIHYHLAGTKKIQQALAKPNVIAKFLKDLNDMKSVEDTFTGLYSLDFNEHGDFAVEMGIKNPQNFVLKPQREGGCNNKYGDDIKNFLITNRHKPERVAWILMDKIKPTQQTNYIVRPNNLNHVKLENVVSELGIFGVILGDEKNVYVNKQAGHMFRTKLATANEGGVATGDGACDSPYLIDY